ncbi:MAG: sialate O-acetylesterase, partial [Bacteroidetes bacterium]|nr:sialate O-acetylesterase [Bacteroidota bacterium]
MKAYSGIVMLLLIFMTGEAQNAKWDSTYRPPSYDLRLAQFRMFPNSDKDIIFLGNSITAGVEWQELLGNPNVRNRGISGDITFGVLARLDEVTEGHPAKIFILIGINDVARDIPDSVTSANHRRIVQYIKTHSPATRIYLQT